MLRTMFLCVMVIYTKVQTHDKNISDNFIVIITVVHWINIIFFVWVSVQMPAIQQLSR